MIKRFSTILLCVGVLLAGAVFIKAEIKKDVLGIQVGMDRVEAIKILQKIGKKDHDERKQQEIWALSNNPYFSHVIIAFDKEYKNVRFVTAKARENGKKMRYSDVLDTNKASLQTIADNYKYILEMPASGKNPGFNIIARGTDKNHLTYFAIEEISSVSQQK